MASWLTPIPNALRWVVIPVTAVAVLIMIRLSAPLPSFDLGRVFFWIVVTLVAAALPVRLPGGVHATITTAPVLAALFDPQLANPFGVCWVALLGTFEPRDLRGEPKWYGTIFNRSNWVVSAFSGWLVLSLTAGAVRQGDPIGLLAQSARSRSGSSPRSRSVG